jgi:Kef-type K+ transport system membrane component KefB
MSFTVLALLVAVGLSGPLLSTIPKLGPPIVVGEIALGLLIGKSGFNLIPVDDQSLTLLSNIGFALLMLIVATHLPLREPALKGAALKAIFMTIVVAGLATGLALTCSNLVGITDPGIIVLLITASSAAVALPILQHIKGSSDKKFQHNIVVLTAWIAVADVATVLAIPLVIREGSVFNVLLGIAIITALALTLYFLVRSLGKLNIVKSLRAKSKANHWALDLRLSLLVLFILAAIANYFTTSILIAGFAAGTVLAMLGQPRRLAQQLIGLGEGFLIPLFFVTLGAKLDISALIHSPANLNLTLLLVAGSVLIHLITTLVFKLPLGSGLVATASLGVPAAVANLGLESNVLTSGQAAAILAAVLVGLIISSIGASILGSEAPVPDHSPEDKEPHDK